jgi:hypothetical protein
VKILQTLLRIYLDAGQLEYSIAFYEELFGEPCQMRFTYPGVGLELAQIGSVLLLSGSEASLAPFKATKATFLVDSLQDCRNELLKLGAIVLEEPKCVPTGLNMRAKHPDGTLVEYVQHVREDVDSANLV